MDLFVLKVETATGSDKYLVVEILGSGDMVVIERFDHHQEALAYAEYNETRR